jgi:acyl-coenzyme A thioesterase PaaI-like protein
VIGHFVPDGRHAGYAGIVHGGLLSALLDECLAWACAVARRSYCVTGELNVRFKRPASLGDRLEISGWTTASWGRYQKAEGQARAGDGTLLATVAATFSAMPREHAEALRRALVFEPGDLDVLGGPER